MTTTTFVQHPTSNNEVLQLTETTFVSFLGAPDAETAFISEGDGEFILQDSDLRKNCIAVMDKDLTIEEKTSEIRELFV